MTDFSTDQNLQPILRLIWKLNLCPIISITKFAIDLATELSYSKFAIGNLMNDLVLVYQISDRKFDRKKVNMRPISKLQNFATKFFSHKYFCNQGLCDRVNQSQMVFIIDFFVVISQFSCSDLLTNLGHPLPYNLLS